MKRFSDQVVAAACEFVAAGGQHRNERNDSEPEGLLRPEQIDRLFNINKENDPLKRLDLMLALSTQMLQEAREQMSRNEERLKELGVNRDPDAFVSNPNNLSDNGLQIIHAAMDDYDRTIEEELQLEASRVMAQMPNRGVKSGLPTPQFNRV
jgi:hypothetical protein